MPARLIGRAPDAPADQVEALLRLDPRRPAGTVVSKDARARVVRWDGDPGVYVKIYRKTPWVAWTHPPGIRSPAEREWQHLLALRARGVPTVEPLAAVEWRALGCAVASALMTRALPDAHACTQLLGRVVPTWPRASAARYRRRLLLALGDLVARCHAAGVTHGDLSLKNVLATAVPDAAAPSLWLVDTPNATIHAAADLRGTPAALADLRALDGRSWCFFTRTDRLRFLATYLAAAGGTRDRAARRAAVLAFYRSIGGPDAVAEYEAFPGRRTPHRWRRRLLAPRQGHRVRAWLSARIGSVRVARYPLVLTLDLRTHDLSHTIAGRPAADVLGELLDALGVHLIAFRIVGPGNDAAAALRHLAQSAGVPDVDGGWWTAHAAPRPPSGTGGCRRPWIEAVVDGAGSVWPCLGATGEPPLGSLAQQSLRDIWQSERFGAARAALRAGRDDGPPCGPCRTQGWRCWPVPDLDAPPPRSSAAEAPSTR